MQVSVYVRRKDTINRGKVEKILNERTKRLLHLLEMQVSTGLARTRHSRDTGKDMSSVYLCLYSSYPALSLFAKRLRCTCQSPLCLAVPLILFAGIIPGVAAGVDPCLPHTRTSSSDCSGAYSAATRWGERRRLVTSAWGHGLIVILLWRGNGDRRINEHPNTLSPPLCRV